MPIRKNSKRYVKSKLLRRQWKKPAVLDISAGKVDTSPKYLEEQGFKRYKKRPVTIYAREMSKAFAIKTMEGVMRGKKGDFLVIGIKGEMYPVDRDIFFKTYEAVSI
jgi:hypothetical protein